MKQVAIIDDHKLVAAGFSHLIELEDEYTIASICTTYFEAITTLDSSIDIAIIDISLPDKNGIELAKYLNENFPNIKKIFVSMYENYYYIKEAKQFGGLGYLSKKCAPDELIEALQTVNEGNEYYSLDILKKIEQSNVGEEKNELTTREFEVLKLLAKGLSPKQVANELDIMCSSSDLI